MHRLSRPAVILDARCSGPTKYEIPSGFNACGTWKSTFDLIRMVQYLTEGPCILMTSNPKRWRIQPNIGLGKESAANSA